MNSARAQNAARLAAEFVVIVVGVLTALAVDEIMEQRQERDRERELLLAFVENFHTDSIEYANLVPAARNRAASAELLLLNFAPETSPGFRIESAVATLGPYEVPAGDEAIARAWDDVSSPSDLDVARGAYTEFSAGGSQRLVRNASLRRMNWEALGAVGESSVRRE